MTQEKRTIEVKVYRTADGKPTCLKSRVSGEACRFLDYVFYNKGLEVTGRSPVCALRTGEPKLISQDHIPHANCELWRGQA